MRRLALVALVTLACGALPAHAQALSLAYQTGDTFKYTYHSTTRQTINAAGVTVPTNLDISTAESVTVKSVDSSGTADLSIALSNFTIKSTTGGVTKTTTTGISPSTIDMTVAADGRVVGINGNPYAGTNTFLTFTGMGSGFFVTAVLPANAVKPGDTWSNSYDQAMPGGAGGIHMTSTSNYLRNESFNGIDAAVVETKSIGTIDISSALSTPQPGATNMGMAMKGTVATDVTTWIDPVGHRVLKTHATEIDDGTMNLHLPPEVGSVPGLGGPMTIQGSATTDLTAA
ncbi:MAG: hypothetical protein WCC30_18090 [Candidatus Dormiibacterota bacterium]